MDIGEAANLGPQSAAWLRAAGVHTLADLEAVGAVTAYLAVKRSGVRASLNLLWALAAALRGEDWRALPADVKTSLRRELAAADG